MQHYKKPLVGMVICGSDPNLSGELKDSCPLTDFPDLHLLDRFAHSDGRLLTLPLPKKSHFADLVDHAVADIVGSR